MHNVSLGILLALDLVALTLSSIGNLLTLSLAKEWRSWSYVALVDKFGTLVSSCGINTSLVITALKLVFIVNSLFFINIIKLIPIIRIEILYIYLVYYKMTLS